MRTPPRHFQYNLERNCICKSRPYWYKLHLGLTAHKYELMTHIHRYLIKRKTHKPISMLHLPMKWTNWLGKNSWYSMNTLPKKLKKNGLPYLGWKNHRKLSRLLAKIIEDTQRKVIIFDGWAQRKRRKFYFSYQTPMEKNFSLPTQLEKFFWAIYHRACAVFRHSWFSHLHGPSSFFPWSIFPTHPSRSGVAPGEYWSFG